MIETNLKQKGSEVENMLTAEYSYEEDIQVKQLEAEQQGRKEGRALGIIEFALDIGYPNDKIIHMLQEKLGIEVEEAEKYLQKYYGKTL